MRIFLFLMMIFFIGCQKKEKKIPVVLGFTSNYSMVAKDIKNGMLLAQDEENNIKFKFIDNKGNVTYTKQIDKKFINKTPLIVGHITSTITKEVVPLFNNTNTILFSPTASTKELSNIDDNFIRIQSVKDFKNIEHILQYIRQFSIKNINIIYDVKNESYAHSLISLLLDKRNIYLKVNKIVPVSFDNMDLKDIDFNTPVYIIGSAKLSAKIVKYLKKHKFDCLIFVSGSAFTKYFINLTGDDGEGVVFFSTFNPDSDNKKYLKFKEKFISKFGYEPGSFEVKGYETAKIISQVIDKKNIKNALINHTFEGLQGKIYIDKYGDTIRKTHIYIINNGIFEKVK